MFRQLGTIPNWALLPKTTSATTPRLPVAFQQVLVPNPAICHLNQYASQQSEPPPSVLPPVPGLGSSRPQQKAALRQRFRSRSWRPPSRRRQYSRRKQYSRRNCGFDPPSPTDQLVNRLRTQYEPITVETWSTAHKVAMSNSPRLPIFTQQVLLRQLEARMATSLSQLSDPDPTKWQHHLNRFALQGIQEDDVHHWIHILEVADTDVKVTRLVSTDRFKPIFVLMAILRTDEHMVKGSTLVKIYDYIAQTYIAQRVEARRAWKLELDHLMVSRTMDSMGNMTPDHFMLVLKRLVHHCLRTFPSSLPMISQLVVEYLRTLGDWHPKRGGQRPGYAVHCDVFNFALAQFRRLPPVTSLANLPHNWKAQRILLGYSAGLKRPYIITRYSYRSIRLVLMGLKKSKDEQMAASRYAKFWPPYIRQLDGTDEARDKEAYLSRAVKAGILKQSEGYSHNLVDYAVDRVAGALPGRSVSIQTRTPPVRLWRFQHRSLSILAYWAAKVRATRNAYEAWQIFHQPPQPGLRPDFQVYAEMFDKLFAHEVDPESPSLPGDGKETYPPHLPNLTAFERERVEPCPPDELYERMIQSGQRPVHQCLTVLIRNAPTVERASQYLLDSGLDKAAVRNVTTDLIPEYRLLTRVPMHIFDAYLHFLCKQQGRRRWKHSQKHSPTYMLHPTARDRYSHLPRAIKLLCTRLGPRRQPNMAPWHTVMRALANQHLVLRPIASWAEDDLAGLKIMMDLYKAYVMTQGPHPVAFDCLCRCILKVLRDKLHTLLTQPHPCAATPQTPRWQALLTDARRETSAAFDMARAAFDQLKAPVAPLRDRRLAATALEALPPLYHELSASHVRTYLEVLAKFGAIDEGVRVVDWVLWTFGRPGDDHHHDVLAKARDPAHKQHHMMREAFVCFRAFVEGSDVDPATVARIEARFQEIGAMGGVWSWPSEGDVEAYVRWRNERETWPEVH